MSDYNAQPTPSTGTTTTETTQPTHASVGQLPKTGSDFDAVPIYGFFLIFIGLLLCFRFLVLPWIRRGAHSE